MRSVMFSLVLFAGVAIQAAAQRPSITRPIQQAREAAAKADARTETAQAVVREPNVRRDSTAVTKAPTTAPTSPSTSTTSKTPAAGTSRPAAPAPGSAKAVDSARPQVAAPTTSTKAASPATSNASAPAAEKSGAAVPPPQVAPGKGAPAGSKAPVTPAPDASTKAGATKAGAPSAGAAAAKPVEDTTAKTVSVGSTATTRPELRIDREVFAYDAGGRRDPFVSLFSTSDLRPLFSDLLLVVINYDPQRRNSVAIMRDATTKEQYRVRQGQLIGRMRVAAIEQKRVLFTIDEFGFSRQESLVIGDTTKVRKQ